MYTRCAHCESWLGISAKQLRVGLGQVRCGCCSQIFNALIHLFDAPSAESQPTDPETLALVASGVPSSLMMAADAGMAFTGITPPQLDEAEAAVGDAGDSDVLNEGECAPELRSRPESEPEATLLGVKPAGSQDAGPLTHADITDAESSISSTEAQTIIGMNADSASAAEAATTDDSHSTNDAASISPAADEQELDSVAASVDDAVALQADTIDDAYVNPDADVDPEALKKLFGGPMVAREPSDEADQQDLLAGVAEMTVDPEDALRARQRPAGGGEAEGSPRVSTVLQADYARLHARKPSAFVRPLLVISAAVALVALPVQYAWFEPQDLVTRYPQARPYVAEFCNHAKCAQLLPEDRTKIELLDRDMRVHPSFEGALQIRVTIVNRGNYAQTYPQLRFTLFNDNGNVIASRLFTPAEYLRRTDVSLLRLQAGETSQIQLDLIAPEDTAVSFEFEFI